METHNQEYHNDWKKLLEATKQCEILFDKVSKNVADEKVLPGVAMGIIQQCLSPGQHHVTLPRVLANRLEQIRKREISILVAGEVSAGKTTLMNILMGGNYLPVSFLETTKIVCELRHHETERRAILKFVDASQETIDLPDDRKAYVWTQIGECIKKKTYGSRLVEHVVIQWPLDIVKELFAAETQVSESNSPIVASEPPDSTENTDNSFDPGFLEAMNKPYIGSFHKQEEHARFSADQHQTARKEIVTSDSDAQPTLQTDTNQSANEQIRNEHTENSISEISRRTEKDVIHEVEGEMISTDSQNPQCAEFVASAPIDPKLQLDRQDFRVSSRRRATANRSVSMGFADTMTPTRELPRGRTLTQDLGSDSTSSVLQACDNVDSQMDDQFQIVLLDCPGIKDKTQQETFTPTLANVASCRAFIFLIDTRGVEETRLQALMDDIEEALTNQDVELNPDCSLFIINKIDIPTKDELEELRAHIIKRLRAKWPLINEKNIINMETRKVLEDVSNGRNESKKQLYELLREFLLTTVRISLEENCLWLLNFLETAHAFAKTGKQWVGLGDSQSKMKATLRKIHARAVDLHIAVSKCSEDDINNRASQNLRNLISEAAQEVQEANWCREEIEREITNDNNEWSEMAKHIDKMIIDRLNSVREGTLDNIKRQYVNEITERFKKHCDELNKIEDMLFGVIPSEASGDKLDARGYVAMLIPCALGGAVRAAPVVFPFVFFAAPLLPIPLLLASLAGEVQYNQNSVKRQEFKTNKVDYFKKRTKAICATVSQIQHHSDIFKYIFGESKQQSLHTRISELLELIQYILSCSLQDTVEHKKVCCGHIIEVIDMYTRHVINCDIDSSDLTWSTRGDGSPKKIGGGGQGNVYEAKLASEVKDTMVAVKEFHCATVQNNIVAKEESLPAYLDAYREYFTLRQLSRKNNRNLVKFLGTSVVSDDSGLRFRLVMEKCFENLNWLIEEEENKDMTKNDFLHHASECTAGLKFLHENNVLHRDIKPENYLVREKLSSGQYRIVICDMGCSKISFKICTTGRYVGSIAYHAPELLRPHAMHTQKSDVYSLGLVLWELAFRRHIPERTRNAPIRSPRAMPSDKNIAKIITSCLQLQPGARSTATDLMKQIEQCQI